MGIQVYGISMSTATRSVLTTLYEKEVEYELVPVDLRSGAHKKPEFLALQPFGKVPVYKDDDLTLFESRAIDRYIATKFEGQGTALLGTNPKERALVEQWVEIESQNYNPVVSALNFQLFFRKVFAGEGPDETVVAAQVEKFNAVLDIYEARLSQSKYLAGDFFSLADLVHLPHTEYLIKNSGRGDLLRSRKHVQAWWDDISSRDSWQKVIALA